MTLRDPWFLLLALLIPMSELVLWARRRHGAAGIPAVRFPNLAPLAAQGGSWRLRASITLPILRVLAGALIALAIARPQIGRQETKLVSHGIDIVLAVDVSSSMLAEDMGDVPERDRAGLSRVEAVKKVMHEFLDHRRDDRIGLVVFGGHAFTQCPLTLDYGILHEFIKMLACVEPGSEDDGTAVGSGIATAVSRLTDTNAKSRVVILLTDGSNNRGELSPEKAAELAAAERVKVYTIGAGSKGLAPYPVMDRFTGRRVYINQRADLDEDSLRKIAETTSARYFRATDLEALRKVYDEIDTLEKTERETPRYLEYDEKFGWPLGAGIAVLLAELLLAGTVFRRVP